MNDLGLFIRLLRTRKGLTQEELGKMVGVQKAAVQKWENGSTKNLKRATIKKLSEIFGVSPIAFVSDNEEEILDIINSLDRDISEKYGNDYEKALAEQRKRDEAAAARDAHILVNTKDADENPLKSNISYVLDSKLIYQIPVYESVSAGFGAYADNDIIDYIPVVIKNPRDVGDTIAIKVTGDSMYPKIENGDLVVVRRQNSVDSGDIAVVLLDGDEGLVKKVVYDDGWIELQSINPEYKPKRYENAEVTRLRVVGKVMQIIKTL